MNSTFNLISLSYILNVFQFFNYFVYRKIKIVINYIRTNFNNIENRIFMIISYIIDFIEFNRKLFNTLFKFRIKIYTLIVLFMTIFFKIVKVFHIRIIFINVNNDFRNIYFYNKYVMSTIFFRKLIKKALL